MKTYLLKKEDLADTRAALVLIKEHGGRVLHVAPIVGGLVVRATAEVASCCELIPWT